MLDIRRPRSPGVSPAGAEPGLNYSFSPTSHRSLVFAVQGVQYTALMPLLRLLQCTSRCTIYILWCTLYKASPHSGTHRPPAPRLSPAMRPAMSLIAKLRAPNLGPLLSSALIVCPCFLLPPCGIVVARGEPIMFSGLNMITNNILIRILGLIQIQIYSAFERDLIRIRMIFD